MKNGKKKGQGAGTPIYIIIIVIIFIVVGIIIAWAFKGSAEEAHGTTSKARSFFSEVWDKIRSGFGFGEKKVHLECNPESKKCEEVSGGGENQCSEVGEDCVPPKLSASFTFTPKNPEEGQNIEFNASGSTGNIESYKWDFGDGETRTGKIIKYAYANKGTYLVKLTVVDLEGNTVETTQEITVKEKPGGNFAPEAKFTLYPPNPNLNEPIQFTDKSTDPNGASDITNYKWDFGDGSTSTEQNPTHSYNTKGIYTVKLTVKDNAGAQSSEEKQIEILEPPVASFNYPSGTLRAQNSMIFDGSGSYDPQGELINTFIWDFGDGGVETGPREKVVHEYSGSGIYTVKLTVITSRGRKNTYSEQINVKPALIELPEVIEAHAQEKGTIDHSTLFRFKLENKDPSQTLSNVKINVKIYNYFSCSGDDETNMKNLGDISPENSKKYEHDNFCDQKGGQEVKFEIGIKSDKGEWIRCASCPDADNSDCIISLGYC